MGIMDTVRSQTRPAGTGGGFLGTDERHQMVELHTPFHIVAMRRGFSAKFKGDGGGQKEQWFVDVEFIDPETGLSYTQVDNETGEETTIRRCITFSATPNRDAEFPAMQKMVSENGGYLGPLMLSRVDVKGQPNPAYIFADWDQNPTGVETASEPAPPPPPTRLISEDGKWEWDGAQWLPHNEAPPPPPAPPAAPPPPDVIPAASVLPFSRGTEDPARTSVPVPPPGTSQPLPEVAEVVTGGDGEGGVLSTTRYRGDQIRQAVYRGDGVVQTPQGGLVQAAAPETPPGQRQAAVANGGIAQEAPPPPPPPPAQQPVQAAATAVSAAQIPENEKPKRVTVPMTGKCPYCNKTAKGSSFKDSKGRWILTHSCESIDPTTQRKRGSVIIDVNDQVVSLIEAAKNA